MDITEALTLLACLATIFVGALLLCNGIATLWERRTPTARHRPASVLDAALDAEEAAQSWLTGIPERSVQQLVADIAAGGEQLGGMSLPCRECGARAVPPVPSLPSPLLPYSDAVLVSQMPVGFAVTASCRACSAPLMSAVLDDEQAAMYVALGVRDGIEREAELRDWLDKTNPIAELS